MSDPASDDALHRHGHEPLGWASFSLVLLTVMFWGGTPVSIKYAGDLFEPFAMSGIRFLIAALFMLFWCWWEGTEVRLRATQFVPTLITAILLYLQIGCFTWGVVASNASHGTLFINTFIFWVAAIEHFIMRTGRLTPQKVLGLIVAAAGVVIVVVTADSGTHAGAAKNSDEPTFFGDALLLASGCLLGIKIIYTKHALKWVESGKLILWHDVFGVVMFAVTSILIEPFDAAAFSNPTSPQFVNGMLGLAYQGLVVAGFCFAVQAWLLRKHAASQISVFSFATPLFGITFAVLLRGDRLSPWLIAAGLCVAAGILLVNRERV